MQALLASYEKDANLLRLGKLLQSSGWKLTGSAGTAKYLSENGIPCEDVGTKIGQPILGHRVVTLAREIYAALLSTPNDSAELSRLGLEPYDLVYVTLYPLEKTIASGGTDADVVEKTDIGGPTLLRAAAKGRRIVLSSPEQIDELETRIKNGSLNDEKYRVALAAAAERRVADYVATSANYWEKKVK